MKWFRRKTVELFPAAAEIGAMIGMKNKTIRKEMAFLGFYVGMAYQIINDLLDYSEDSSKLDKNISDDLGEGKTILPWIYSKQKANSWKIKLIRETLKRGSLKNLFFIMQIISDTKAQEYTQQYALQEIEKAKI